MEKIYTPKAPAAIGPYSQAVRWNDVVYTSGQIPIIPETGELCQGDITAQTTQVMENLKAVLEAADSGMDYILKTTCYLDEIADFAAFNEVYAKYICHQPARSCFAVKDLPKQALLEVEVIALIKD